MIGVVVWSSEAREKAVIWCEDQAALAYLQGCDNLCAGTRWPQPGDLLELESEMVGILRHARNVTLLSDHARPDLPEILRQHAERGEAPSRESHLRLVVSHDDDDQDTESRPLCPLTRATAAS